MGQSDSITGPSIGLIITAAGQSSRFGENKLWVEIQGTALIGHTINRCLSSFSYSEIIITVSTADYEKMSDTIAKMALGHPNIQLILGGKTRQESVEQAVNALTQSDFVLIHDGARPNPSPHLIQSLIDAVQVHQAVIPVISMDDTVKHVQGSHCIQTVDRDQLKRAQTPQAFSVSDLRSAYKKLKSTRNSSIKYTDESSIIEPFRTVETLPGERQNLKITHPEDIVVFESYVRSRS